MASSDAEDLYRYNFPLDPIPRLKFSDPEVDNLIKAEKPVVLTDGHFVDSALKWDLEYLEEHLGNDNYTVYSSKSNKFKYYDEAKLRDFWPADFQVPMVRADMKFSEFRKRIRDWKEGEDRLYLQQALHITVGSEVIEDFRRFDWNWLNAKQKCYGWGPLTSNLLFVGMAGNQTPVHYDEQQNFFCELQGRKRCILFPPSQFRCLYPYPVYHPHDRQSQVCLEEPDYDRFPGMRSLHGCETILSPGEVLYIPMYWWHHIVSLGTSHTITVNFWYKASPHVRVERPLKYEQKVAMMRNIEKMLMEAFQDPTELGPFLHDLVSGRFPTQRTVCD